MTIIRSSLRLSARFALTLVLFLSVKSVTVAQTANPPASEATPAPATVTDSTTEKNKDDTVVLNKFVVDSSKDSGFLSKSTLSAFGSTANIMDVPQPVQIANQTVIQGLKAQTQYDAVAFTAGGVTRRSVNPGDDQFIWGFRSNTTLRDGVPYNVNGGPLVGLYEIDRVEVLKGAAALIYGQDAYTGGVVNIVTRQPTDTFHAEAGVTLGNYNYKKGEIHVSGPIMRGLTYRADAGATDSDFSNARFSFYKDGFFGMALDYLVGPRSKLTINASYYDVRNAYPISIADPKTGHLLVTDDKFSVQEPWTYVSNRMVNVSAKLVTSLSDTLESRSVLVYQSLDADNNRPVWATIDPVTRTMTGVDEHPMLPQHFTFFQQDFLKFLKTGPLTHRIQAGFEQRNTNQALNRLNYALPAMTDYLQIPNQFPTTTVVSETHTVTRDRISGLYVQDIISLFDDRVNLVAGARYNQFFQTTGVPVTPTGGTQTVQAQSKDIRRGAVLLKPTKEISLYYNYAEAFLFNSGVDVLNNPLPPSTGISKEIGGKVLLLNGDLLFTASYFNVALTNVRTAYVQGPGDPNPGSQALRVQGQQTNKGYDLALNLSHKFDLGTLNTMATLYHGNVRDNLGKKVLTPANNTYSILTMFTFKGGSLNGLSVAAGQRYQGSRDGYAFSGAGFPVVKWDAYTNTVAMASYQFSNYKLQLNVENIFDNKWVDGGEGPLWLFLNPGRQIKLSANYTF